MVLQVSQGLLPYNSAKAILEIAFGLTSEEAEAILGDAETMAESKDTNEPIEDEI